MIIKEEIMSEKKRCNFQLIKHMTKEFRDLIELGVNLHSVIKIYNLR